VVDLFRYRKWDLVSKRGLYYVISGLMLLAGLFALCRPGGGLHQGIDFKGGGLVTYMVDGHLPQSDYSEIIRDIRETLKSKNVENEVQISAGSQADFGGAHNTGDVILVRTLLIQDTSIDQDSLLAQQIKATITPTVIDVVAKHLPGAKAPTVEGQEVVTGTVSTELVNKGVFAVVLGSILILFWIWIRYNVGGFGWRYAVAGILALVHDLLTLVGMFALLRNYLQVNSPFIAALLTVLGYSIHDTIVIFDRIRENMRLRKGRTFAETVNISLLETMARSVNTILTVLFSLLALFFFGGPTLRDFTAAMLIGVIVGGYSSIFVASQLLVSWSTAKEKEMLPPAEVPAGIGELAKVAMAQSALPTGGSAPVTTIPTSASVPTASTEALQRAKEAGRTAPNGKTAKRRR